MCEHALVQYPTTSAPQTAGNINVSRAAVTNLLEDDLEVLQVSKSSANNSVSTVTIPMRGFQVVMV